MANSLPILTFHDIANSSSAISFPPDVFEETVKRIADRGYRTINLSTVLEFLSRDAPFPDLTLAITFDDGYESTYKEAFPALQKFGMTATVFLILGDRAKKGNFEQLPSSNGHKMLLWDQIHEMKSAGIEFGSHSLTHPDLTRLSEEQINHELRESKNLLESLLEREVSAFAYPYGYHTPTIRKIAKKYYSLACSGRMGLVKKSSDPFALERVDMYYFRTAPLSNILMSRVFPVYVSFRNVPRQLKYFLRRGRLL
jgi:peptidoglycan/xylan/chitin deacetylase (PgdA/CDA1 family)